MSRLDQEKARRVIHYARELPLATDEYLLSRLEGCVVPLIDRDDALTAAVAIRESTLNPAMGYSHKKHLLEIANRLEASS